MKTFFRLTVCVLFVSFIYSCNGQQPVKAGTPPPGADVREKIAASITSNLAKKNYAAVRKDFAKIMLDGLPEDKIKSVWEDLLAKIGDYQGAISAKEEQLDGYTVVKTRCRFKSENATIQVTFNDENQVIGLFIKM